MHTFKSFHKKFLLQYKRKVFLRFIPPEMDMDEFTEAEQNLKQLLIDYSQANVT